MSVGGNRRQHRGSSTMVVTDEARMKARQRSGKPDRESNFAKKMAAVPGGAGLNRGPRGQVRTNEFGVLEYWKKKEETWIPAVYHYEIREKLINMGKTCEADVYSHPRARGDHELDVTAFLDTQKTWDLERDHGWIDIPELYMFAPIDRQNPTYKVPRMYDEGRVVLDLDNHPVKAYRDIPLTLSSQVEPALMEAIRRLDPRITWIDLLVRCPRECGKGFIYKPQTLSGRVGRWRLENAVSSLIVRKGTKSLNDYLWEQMSLAARNANSTRELSKLSKEQQAEARAKNAGKHDANAGGWKRTKEARQGTRKEVSAPVPTQMEGAARPASSSSGKNKRSHLTVEVDHDVDKESRLPPFAPEQGRRTRSGKRQRVRDSTPSASRASQNPYAETQYEDASFSPFLEYGPSSSSSGVCDVRPTDVVNPALPNRNGQNLFAGFDTVTEPIYALARAPLNSQHCIPTAQGYSAHWIPGAEGILGNPYVDFYQQTRPFDLVEEEVFSASGPITNTLSNGAYNTAIHPSVVIDYRSVPPRNEDDMIEIQVALSITRASYSEWRVGECPSTARHQSYFYQVSELRNSFAQQWVSLGRDDFQMPYLEVWEEPWRNGFKDWMASQGGDEAFWNEPFDQYNGDMML